MNSWKASRLTAGDCRGQNQKVREQCALFFLAILFALFGTGCLGIIGSNPSSPAGTSTLQITTTTLPNGQARSVYQAPLSAAGGTAPYTWSETGTLPAGLSLSANGVISGTPTQSGQFFFTARVNDSSQPHQTSSKALSLQVMASSIVLQINTTSLPSGQTGTNYQAAVSASGGTPPYNWSISSGLLPTGLSLDAGSGMISGIPTQSGSSTFTIQVRDSVSAIARQMLTIQIAAPGQGGPVSLMIVGNTTSTSYPVTNNSACIGCPGENGVVSFLDRTTTSTSPAFSTYLGGASGFSGTQWREAWVDAVSGDLFIGGRMANAAPPFPTTAGVFQPTSNGGPDEALICRFTSAGAEKWCSYLGTNGTQTEETVYGIAGLDSSGNLLVCGRMNNIVGATTFDGAPWTKYGVDAANLDAGYVAKIKGDGSALLWFTSFMGSSTGDGIRGRCALDFSGNVYAGGETASMDFPATPGTFQTVNRSRQSRPEQGIVVKINSDGKMGWASYLGGSSTGEVEGADGGVAIAKDGSVYVCGMTESPDLFPPGTPGFQTTMPGPGDSVAYVAKIRPDGSAIVAGTYLGGAAPSPPGIQHPECDAMTLDAAGNVIVAGDTSSPNFPVTSGAYQMTIRGLQDATLSKLSPDLLTLLASTYIGGSGNDYGDHSGGIGFDSNGNIYSMIGTSSADFPTTADAYQATYVGQARDMAIFGLTPNMTTLVYGTYLGGPVPSTDQDGNWPWALAVVAH